MRVPRVHDKDLPWPKKPPTPRRFTMEGAFSGILTRADAAKVAGTRRGRQRT